MKRRQAGQAMVEAALVLPLLLFLLFGVIELGRVANIQQTLDDAAREGARWSALPAAGSSNLPSAANVEQRVIAIAAAQDIALSDGDITVNQDVAKTEGGLVTAFSEVDVSYTYDMLTPALAAIVPSISISAHATMRNETN